MTECACPSHSIQFPDTHTKTHDTRIHQTGAILHLLVRVEGGEVVTRRLMVPCETAAHAHAFKYKMDQALLAFQSNSASAAQRPARGAGGGAAAADEGGGGRRP